MLQELIKEIKSRNEKTKAWVAEDPKNRWAGLYPEDEAHWVERGITSLADLERDELATYIYEGHKDAFGTKGRHYDFKNMTLAELKEEADYISNAVKNTMQEEAEAEKQKIAEFEAQIKHNMAAGAEDKETAIRWLLDAEGLADEKDMGYICYSLGLPYSMEKEFESILNK